MTHIIPKNAPEPRGNGRIRRSLPALGLVAAAISGFTSQSGGSEPVPAPERVAAVVTVPMIVQEATLLHFARAQGIGDAIRETGIPFTDPINARLEEIREIVEEGRTEATAYRVDMAYSAGYLDALEGGWDLNRLENYTESIFRTERGILELSDQATLRWSEHLGLEEGRALVTGTIALTVAQDPYEPIWSGSVEEGPHRGAAFVEVSTSVRLILDEMHEAAYVPSLPRHELEARSETEDPFQGVPPFSACGMEI
ncbi:hypothetical protein IQ03_03897 [Gemmobacter caeni]|uniref:Uncharacterized protein n=1 Tax=Gemmobacter caeni TaxID=589035 RepID=A0A2T6B995_9RHOB|nr:hypothetical protein [Gemmobacter caeni]PTX52647.1 hypothetical protein C8N34_102465 [Gemmobacter caeni]TWI94898.1 hypothetical protein IQ03_03897 [Gemmobacter caeni]